MHHLVSETKLSLMLKQRNSCLLLALILLVTVFFESVTIFSLRYHERIVIVPPTVNQRFWVEHNKVSVSYLDQISRYVLDQLLNITPETYLMQLETIFPYVESKVYGEFKQKWYEKIEKIRHQQISTVFYPFDISVDQSHLIVKVVGKFVVMSGNSKPIKRYMNYQLHYQYLNGKLWIKKIDEKIQNA